ncbi:hypothetical protein L3X38_003173 [Prunus dulcis]|uniref:Uncharacterized protein n=1 Tax=Prunus dulcis TaxID=3755 RepID=A0AAD5F1C8_PRUDU|nr:hypothetical protein L3X38_003173 [Prunus dulcis]
MATRAKAGVRKPNPKYAHHALVSTDGSFVPTSFSQANKLQEWRLAMTDEFNALLRAGTCTLVPRPPAMNVLPNKWVFRVKRILMALFSVIRLARWPMVFINNRALTMVKSLVLLLIILLLALSWLFLCSSVGLFVSWMFRMPFYMATLIRRFICASLLALLIPHILIMSTAYDAPFMVLSKPLALGSTVSFLIYFTWVLLLLSPIRLSLCTLKASFTFIC